ncbi:MAG: hypothetical protein WC100_04795 [Sterolibacterium sp.]
MKRAHIIPMAGGDEYDALTLWRHVLRWKALITWFAPMLPKIESALSSGEKIVEVS